MITIDMSKARDIHRERMRQDRAPKLAALDIAFQRAVEAGESTAVVVTQKRALRDVTADPAIDAAQSPEALKAVWPDCLVVGV